MSIVSYFLIVSPSGNYHGMPVAHLMGLIEKGKVEGFDWFTPCLKPENLVYIALRDIDKNEKKFIKVKK
jgi:arginase